MRFSTFVAAPTETKRVRGNSPREDPHAVRPPHHVGRLVSLIVATSASPKEPETNGVAERWNRTLKEQAIHGRIFQNLEAVRAAVADFVERYNQTWRLEKLGYHTPIEAREEYELRQAA